MANAAGVPAFFYWLTVKDHAFCCKPVVELFWSRGLPATSFAPVLTTAF